MKAQAIANAQIIHVNVRAFSRRSSARNSFRKNRKKVIGHGAQPIRERIHVPLIIHVPGRAPARRTDLASLIDLAPTLLSLAGCEPLHYSRGVNLFDPTLQSSPEDFLFSEMLDYTEAQQYAVITQDWKYMRRIGEKPHPFARPPPPEITVELYSRTHDPLERENVADAHPEVVEHLETEAQRFMAALDATEAGSEDAHSDADDMGLTDAQIEKLQALGYLE